MSAKKLSPFFFLIGCLFLFNLHFIFADEIKDKGLQKLNAEIIEVEELKDPRGAAIYTVRDLSSGKTFRLFVDPHKSLVQSGGKLISAGDTLGGSKAVIIYKESTDREMPQVIFARITSSYYS